MLSVFADRVKDTSSAQGSSTITLANSPPSGFQSFGAGVGDGNPCVYCVSDTSGNWEVNYGVYTDSAKTLARPTTPIASSNAGAQASFSGTVTVALVDPAEQVGAMNWGIPAGRLYVNAFIEGQALGTGSPGGINQFWGVPIWIREWFSAAKVHFNITTLQAGSGTVDVGLYGGYSTGTLELLGSAAGIPTGSGNGGATGDNSVALTMVNDQPHPPGLYVVGYIFSTGSPTMEIITSSTTQSSRTVFGSSSTTDTGRVTGFNKSSVNAPLPSPLTGFSVTGANMPYTGMEVS